MLSTIDNLNVADFVFGILGFIVAAMATSLMQLIRSRLPHARLQEVNGALVEALSHVQMLVDGEKITEERAAKARLGIVKLRQRYKDLWLEVDRWTALGWKRFMHPTFKEIRCSCSDLLRRIATLRDGLRHQHPQVFSVKHAVLSRTNFLSTLSKSNSVSSNSTDTLELSEPSPSPSSSLSTNPSSWSVVELDILARPPKTYQRLKVQRFTPQESQLTQTEIMPQSSATAHDSEHISTSTEPDSDSSSAAASSVTKAALDHASTEQVVHTVALEAEMQEVEDTTLPEPVSRASSASPSSIPESTSDSASAEEDIQTELLEDTGSQEVEETSASETTLGVAITNGQETHASGVETHLTQGTSTVRRNRRTNESEPEYMKILHQSGPHKGFRVIWFDHIPELRSRIWRGEDLVPDYGERQVESLMRLTMAEYSQALMELS